MTNLKKYLHAPRLTREEEAALINKWQQNGDKKAQEELVLRHMYLAHARARRFSHPDRQDYEDLLSEGLIGLMDASTRFRLEYGIPFAAYAQHWVMKDVREFRRRSTAVYIPREEMSHMGAVNQAVETLTNIHGIVPSDEAVALRTGLKKEVVKRLRAMQGIRVASGDQPYTSADGSDGRTAFEGLAAEVLTPEASFFAKQELKSCTESLLRILQEIKNNPKVPEDHFRIIRNLFGLNEERRPKTPEELGLTVERAKKIMNTAFMQIRVSEGRLNEERFRELLYKIRSLEEIVCESV